MARSRWDEVREQRGWNATRIKQLARRHSHYARIDTATVATNETTTSTSYTDLATVGPSVTIDVGPTGLVLVFWAAQFRNSTIGSFSLMAIDVTGANTVAAGDADYLGYEAATANQDLKVGRHHLFELDNPGPTTFTAKYRVTGNTGGWQDRRITALSLDLALALG